MGCTWRTTEHLASKGDKCNQGNGEQLVFGVLCIKEVSFDRVGFLVQVHNLPLEMITIKNARTIGSIIGDLVRVDDKSWENGNGKSFITVRVSIDTTKPLVDGFWVPREGKGRKGLDLGYY